MQVGEFRLNMETPVGRADLSAPFALGKESSQQRRRPALLACGDLNLPAKAKDASDRQLLEDTFSYRPPDKHPLSSRSRLCFSSSCLAWP